MFIIEFLIVFIAYICGYKLNCILLPIYIVNSLVINETLVSLQYPVSIGLLTTIYLTKRYDFSDIL